MHHLRLAAVAASMLILAACSGGGGGTSSSSQQSSAAQQTEAPAKTTQVAAKPATEKDLKPLYGSWGLDPANCGDQVLKISKARFEGPGSGCDITGYTDNGDGTYTAAMTCSASGKSSDEKIQMRPIFAPTGEGIDLVYLDRKNQQTEVLRCEATD
jgi:hypothetical protein